MSESEIWLIMVGLSERKFELKKGEWRVSEIAGCLRRAMLARVLDVDPIIKTPESVIGALWHKYVFPPVAKEWARKKGFKIDFEVEIREFPLVGHVDAILKKEDKVYPWEFKVTFWELGKFKDIRMAHVIEQANMYAGILKTDKFRVTVVSLYDGEPVVFDKWFDFDEEKYLQRKMEANGLNEAIANKRMVRGPRYIWECAHCKFDIICKYLRDTDAK